MANRECEGDFFSAEGVRYYRCLWDGTTMLAPATGDKCPNCSPPDRRHRGGRMDCAHRAPGYFAGRHTATTARDAKRRLNRARRGSS